MSNKIPQELYDQIISNIPIACVDVCIVDRGSVLLLKRIEKPVLGEWWLPGGRVYKGETLVACAQRKCREETGITCNPGPILHTAETVFPDGPNDIPIHSINTCFMMFPAEKDFTPQLDSSHMDYKWISTVSLDLHTYVRDCLSKAGLPQQV